MFCTKCGAKIEETAKFCTSCGATVSSPDNLEAQTQPVATEQPKSTAQSEPVIAEQQPSVEPVPDSAAQAESTDQTESVTTGQQSVEAAPVQPQAKVQSVPANADASPAAAQAKKPFPKKALIGIIAGAAAVLAVVVAAIVIISSLNKVNVKDFVKLKFNDGTLYENHAAADVYIDNSAISKKYIDGEDDDYDYSDINDLIDAVTNAAKKYSGSISSITDYCTVSAYVKGGEQPEDGDTATKLENLGSDDIIVVSLRWAKGESAQSAIKQYEDILGISFSKSDEDFEISVADELKREDLAMKTGVDIDLFGQLEKNGYVKTEGCVSGELICYIDEFEQDIAGYTFKHKKGSSYINAYKGSEELGSVSLTVSVDGSESSYYYGIEDLSDGEVITFGVNSQRIGNSDAFITDESYDFKVIANQPLDESQAKSNVAKLEQLVKDTLYSWSDSYSIIDITLLSKTEDGAERNMLAFSITNTYSAYSSLYVYKFKDIYIDGDDIKYDDYDYDYIGMYGGSAEGTPADGVKSAIAKWTSEGYKSVKIK